jgi:hypothetical protein
MMAEHKTYILNFGHALRAEVIEQLHAEEIRIRFDLDMAVPTPRQVASAVQKAATELRRRGESLDDGVPLLVVLPRMREGAVLLLTELHGRMGFFPRVVNLRRLPSGVFGLQTLSDEDQAKIRARLDALASVPNLNWEQRQERALLTAELQSASGVLDLEQLRQAARGRRG